MDFNAAHIGFVYSAYGLTAIFLLGLAVLIYVRDKRMAKAISKLDTAGRRAGDDI